MLNESLKVKGTLTLVLTDENGNVKNHFHENLVVSAGLAHIASRIKDNTSGTSYNIAIGTGTTATAVGQTALTTESARGASTVTLVTTTYSNDSVQYVTTFAAGVGTAAITEAGIFNAASGGTMLCRTVFPVINKGSLDTLTITWKLVIA